MISDLFLCVRGVDLTRPDLARQSPPQTVAAR